MTTNKSSLSAGEIIRAILIDDQAVSAITTTIVPVRTDGSSLPCIVCRRASMETRPQNSGAPASDIIELEISCRTAGYAEGLELAEAVREALDYVSITADGLRLRSCYLAGSEEAVQDKVYIQKLMFNIKL